MATSQFIRLRAGMYVTRDAKIRIVRRKFLNQQVTRWDVESWSPGERMYWRHNSFKTLAAARDYVSAYVAAMEA